MQRKASLTTTVARVLFALALALVLPLAEITPPITERDRASAAEIPADDFKPGEVLVRFQDDQPATSFLSLLAAQGLRVKGYTPHLGFYLLTVPEGRELPTVAALRSDPHVEYAGLNHRVYAPEPKSMPLSQKPTLGASGSGQVTPDDPLYMNWQWNLDNWGQRGGTRDADIDAPEGWNITTGSDEIIIAVLDSGVDLLHEDLADKLWTNPNEIPANGLDDDGNGYIDDVHGWDFVNGDSEPQDDPPPYGVGTAVAGIAAAATNNGKGVAGISWGARIMPLKVLENGAGWISYVIEGIEYAVEQGARVVNMSFTALREDEALQQAIRDAHEQHGLLFTAMAGDCGNVCFINGDPFFNPITYPAAFEHVIAVGATDEHDRRLSLSGWGPYLDVMAPGRLIPAPYWDPYSEPPHTYALFAPTLGSTAIAAPHVAGLAALIWSIYPDLSPDEVESILKASADKVGPEPYDESGRNDLYGYGRISADPIVLEPVELIFLADDERDPACRTVSNRGISAPSWEVTTTAEWLSVDGPFGFAPSWIDVCIAREGLADYRVYTSTITATTTLTGTVHNPHTVSVSLSYRPSLPTFFLSHIFKRHAGSP